MAPPHINRRSGPWSAMGVLLATVVLAGLLASWFEERAHGLRAKYGQELSAMQQQWANESAARQAAAREATRRRQSQLEQALGGPAEAVVRNPELTLQQMLEQLARACAPAGASVVVSVDRFTEFEVFVTLKTDPGSNQLAETTTCLLRHGAPYIHSLRFLLGRRVLAELNERAIESVPDWSQVSVETAQALLAAPAQRAGDEAQTTAAPEQDAELTGERQRLQQAEEAFSHLRSAQFDRLKEIMTAQERAVRLESMGSASDLADWIKWLSDESVLQVARPLCFNPEPEYRRLLTEQSLDPLAVDILCRGVRERWERQRPYLTKLVDAVAARQRATKDLLVTMQSQWGNWHGGAAAGQIYFDSPSARDAFSRAKVPYEEARERLERALRACADFSAVEENKR